MDDDRVRLKAELAKIEQAIAAQEGLRGILPDEQLEATLAALRGKQAAMRAQLAGSGAIAQGEKAKAAGERGVVADTIKDSTIVTGDHSRAVRAKTYVEKQVIESPPGLEPETLRQRYLTELATEANRLPWASLDPDYADPGRGESLGLVDVYTALDTTELERVETEDELRAYLSRQGEARRISAQAMINDQPRLVLLGDPGSGKSTLVNFMAYVLAQAGRAEAPGEWLKRLEQNGPWRHGALLPVRVVLRDFAAGLPENTRRGGAGLLLSYLRHTLKTLGLADYWPHLQAALADGEQPLLFLFDGLDEVPASLRRIMVDTVNDLVGRYPAHRYLVTCRIYAYVGQPGQLHGFHQATLAPFSGKQIGRFIAAWYDELARRGRFNQGQAKARAERLGAVVAGPDLRGLAERPLLLTVMALLHTFRGQLPEDRVELYRWTVDLLLRRWEERVGDEQGILEALNVPGLKMSDLEAGLYEVAFRAHAGQSREEGTADVAEADLRGWLAPYLGGSWDRAGQFVGYVRERAGLLVRHKPAAYTFPHRTFQEYLAACHLLAHPDFPAEAARLAREDPDRWREVFVMAAGQAARTHRLGSALSAVNALCSRPEPARGQPVADGDWLSAPLAGEALLEIGLVGVGRDPLGQVLLERVQGWLVALLRSGALAPRQRTAAGDVLAQLGDPRFRADAWYLPDEPLLGFLEIPAGPFLMGTQEEDIPTLLERFGGMREWYEQEIPQHEVKLPAYYIARYPVTVAQFRAFVEESEYKLAGVHGLHGPDNHSVVWVSPYDAQAYCDWLTEQLQTWDDTPEPLAELLRGGGWQVRLPTEAEWEKAARGEDGRIFPWGDEPDPNRANYRDTGIGTTSAVGCFPGGASPHGVEDMSGNVYEWCHSLYKPYPYDPADGREDPEARGRHVLRGGAFYDNRWVVRCAFRFRYLPDYGFDGSGFRLVVAPGF